MATSDDSKQGIPIYNLPSLSVVRDDALMLVSQDYLTRKITLAKLKEHFTGGLDGDTTSDKFVTVLTFNERLSNILNQLEKIYASLSNTENMLVQYQGDVIKQIAEIQKDVKALQETFSKTSIMNMMMPVGTIYTTSNETLDPAQVFLGKWTKFGTETKVVRDENGNNLMYPVYIWRRDA